jgi:hypothetical protein
MGLTSGPIKILGGSLKHKSNRVIAKKIKNSILKHQENCFSPEILVD